MGDFRITIDGVGNHGCGRGEETEEAGKLVMKPCGSATCVDCIARETVAKLKSAGSVQRAKLEHWPAESLRNGTGDKAAGVGPVDDLLRGTRSERF